MALFFWLPPNFVFFNFVDHAEWRITTGTTCGPLQVTSPWQTTIIIIITARVRMDCHYENGFVLNPGALSRRLRISPRPRTKYYRKPPADLELNISSHSTKRILIVLAHLTEMIAAIRAHKSSGRTQYCANVTPSIRAQIHIGPRPNRVRCVADAAV